jgi:uncharacterized protein (DUF58 family)
MKYPAVKRRSPGTPEAAGVYARLDDLVRLQFKATGFSFLPRQPLHSVLAGKHASRLRGRGLNFEEIRRYLPGDDIRTMDWKITARMRDPFVRVYTEERDRPVLLVVDQKQTMFFGSRERMKSVTAAEAAALAAWRVLSQGDRVGAIVFNDEESVEIRPQRSRRTVDRILKEVVRLNRLLRAASAAAPERSMLDFVLQRAARLATHDWLVCLITDTMGLGDEGLQALTRLALHNDVLLVAVYDPLGQQMSGAGRVVFAEGGAQLEIDTSDARFQQRYAAAFQREVEVVEATGRRRQIPVIAVSTAEGVAEQVGRRLGRTAGKRQ